MSVLKHTVLGLIIVFGFIEVTPAQSIVLRQARDAPVPIAIQEFRKGDKNDKTKSAVVDIEAMLTANLIFSRLFKPIPTDAHLKAGTKGPLDQIKVDPWKQVGADYVVRAELKSEGNRVLLDGFVFKVSDGKMVLKESYSTGRGDYTILAHQFGDDIVEIVTGEKGLFSTKIAFSYRPPNSKKGEKEIWVMDFNGRNPEPLVQNGDTNLSPEWTLDGRSIVFTRITTLHAHLWRSDLNGKAKQITNFGGNALSPSMLPNGKEMLVSLSKDGNAEIYVIDLNGKVKKQLTKNSVIDLGPSASPDGKKMCYSSGNYGDLHLFVMDLASGKKDRRTRVGKYNDTCAWHPSENFILFSGMDLDREFDIFAMNDQGNEMERLTYDATNNESPAWSPDGKLIVFSSKRTGKNEIYVIKADGTQLVKITDLPGDASQPAWSPRLGY